MELTALYRCVAALDVHQAKLTVCIMYENELGETQEFCNGQVKQDTFLSSLLIEFPLKFQRGLVA